MTKRILMLMFPGSKFRSTNFVVSHSTAVDKIIMHRIFDMFTIAICKIVAQNYRFLVLVRKNSYKCAHAVFST